MNNPDKMRANVCLVVDSIDRNNGGLAAGRKIFAGEFPERVVVYLIEAQELGLGLGLSEPVRASAQQVVARIRRIIDEYSSH